MRILSRFLALGLLAAAGLYCSFGAATASPLPAAALASDHETPVIEVGRRWHRSYKDDYYEYDLPPPPPAVIYRVPPLPPPVVIYRRPVLPPIIYYQPPVYGWMTPPRPANCGRYRYWNGVRCADARREPPYLGPRW